MLSERSGVAHRSSHVFTYLLERTGSLHKLRGLDQTHELFVFLRPRLPSVARQLKLLFSPKANDWSGGDEQWRSGRYVAFANESMRNVSIASHSSARSPRLLGSR
jgi:hypothetical protein